MAKLRVSKFVDISDAQAFYLAQVDAIATEHQERQTSPDRETIYSLKHAEAKAIKSKKTPWIDAEAKALGKTRQEVAESILVAREAWQARMLEVETARLKAKQDIRSAESPAEAYAAVGRFRLFLQS